MKKIILFSPKGYVGGYIKKKILNERQMQYFEITRDSNLDQYQGDYDVMVYSAAVRYADADKYVQDNVEAAIAMVNFCKKHHVKRIIYLSSDAIYGEIHTDIVTERAVMVNPGTYGVTKYLAEKIIIESGIPYYILRMPGIVGGSWSDAFLCRLMDSIRNNETVKLYNINREFNNVLHIDDLTKFIVLLSNRTNSGKSEIFLLGNTEKIKLQELAIYIKGLYDSTSQIKDAGAGSKKYFTLDVAKAAEYGYSSKKITEIAEELYKMQR